MIPGPIFEVVTFFGECERESRGGGIVVDQ